MNISVFDTLELACHEAATHMASLIQALPNPVLGLATGRTPLKLYEHLIQLHQCGLSFETVTTFNLDEYYGLPENHLDTYRTYMNQNLFDHVDIIKSNTHMPIVSTNDVETTCMHYDQLIKCKGGIDLQIIGVGLNGHIGFNEPAQVFKRQTHLANLSEVTIQTNQQLVADFMPQQAITMGIQSIFESKQILILANGKEKGAIIKKALSGVVTPEVPLSILTLHPNTLLWVDQEAYEVFADVM